MEIQKTIVDRIRFLANSQGYSLTTLEVKLSLGNGTISRWNKSAPNSDKLLRVADFFHVSTDYLLGREPSNQESDYATYLHKLREPVSHASTLGSKTNNSSTLTPEDIAAIFCVTKDQSLLLASEDEISLIKKFRLLDARGQSAVLNTLEHELASLPGGNASSAPKQA